MRSTARSSASTCSRTCSSRRAASCRRRCRVTRRTSSRATTPTRRARCSPPRGSTAPFASPASRRGRTSSRWSRAAGRRCSACGSRRRRGRPTRRGRRRGRGRSSSRRSSSPAGSRATADPEYYLRLLLHSESKTNEGGYAYAPFDELVERARQERRDRERLELYHAADRMAVAEQAALIPIAYGRSTAIVKPQVHGWWEFGKTSAAFADLTVDPR